MSRTSFIIHDIAFFMKILHRFIMTKISVGGLEHNDHELNRYGLSLTTLSFNLWNIRTSIRDRLWST